MLAKLLSVDPRALAALRIGAGVLLALDLLARLPLVPWLYSDAGVLPRAALDALPTPTFWSGSAAFEIGLHAVLLAACGLLVVGKAARSASFACWLGLLSLVARQPGISNAGDLILMQLLLWGSLLPIADRASLRGGPREVPIGARVLSPASAGLVLLMPAVYFSSVFHKAAGSGWLEGTIVHYTVLNETWSRPFGAFLTTIPGATEALTWGTLALELVGPLLLFSPVATAPLRIVAIAAFFGLQAGIGLSIELWLFPFISSLALVPLLPGVVWDRLSGVESKDEPDPGAVAAFGPLGRVGAAISFVALALFAGSHVESLLQDRGRKGPIGPISQVAGSVGLRQNWVMYSSERTWDERLLVRGEDTAGRRSWIDDRGEHASWPPIARLRESYRGRRLLVRLEYHRRPAELRGFADWVCRTREAEGGPPIDRVGLVSWRRPIDHDDSSDGAERRLLLEHDCR